MKHYTNIKLNQLTVMCTTRGDVSINQYQVPEEMRGKQIGHSLQNDAYLDQNIPCGSRVMSIFTT